MRREFSHFARWMQSVVGTLTSRALASPSPALFRDCMDLMPAFSFFETSRSCICLISAVWTQLYKHFTSYILIFLSVYSGLHVLLHVSSLSSKSKTAFVPCKTQTQRQDFPGIWTVLEFAILKSCFVFVLFFFTIFQSSEATLYWVCQ